jgi:hypothetical protein
VIARTYGEDVLAVYPRFNPAYCPARADLFRYLAATFSSGTSSPALAIRICVPLSPKSLATSKHTGRGGSVSGGSGFYRSRLARPFCPSAIGIRTAGSGTRTRSICTTASAEIMFTKRHSSGTIRASHRRSWNSRCGRNRQRSPMAGSRSGGSLPKSQIFPPVEPIMARGQQLLSSAYNKECQSLSFQYLCKKMILV